MLDTKYLSNKVFYYIYPRGKTLSYIACEIISAYSFIFKATPGQDIFGIYLTLNLMPSIGWRLVTA